MITRMSWFFSFVAVAYVLLNKLVFNMDLHKDLNSKLIPIEWKIGFFFVVITAHVLKYIFFKKGLLESPVPYLINKIFWLFIVSVAIVFMNIGVWSYVIILFPILAASLSKGTKPGLLLVACSFIMHLTLTVLALYSNFSDLGIISSNIGKNLALLVFLYSIVALLAVFCGMIRKDNAENEKENNRLMGQLEEKYLQLEVAQEEIKLQYEKLKGTNSRLEETNKKLSGSIAEFYTLQQISQAIGSILDIQELLKHLNDIILGVMGVNYSTIILYDEKTCKLKVQTTNIANSTELAILMDNINDGMLTEAIDKGQHLLENRVDQQQYLFTRGRDVKSLICVPLNTKSRKFGLVLVEHRHRDAFDEDNVRLLSIIAQQVGIAMENADLYQKMQEIASRDGLTGVYNRQYFQERLELEINNAQDGDYPLSLAIFDIDHFKRFNDTFGHLFGDKVLKSIVESIVASLRENDITARYGGEEFILLFPGMSLDEAYEKVESLRRDIAQCVVKDKLVATSVTASFGLSSFKECALSGNELLRSADDALYEAKAAGRNCIRTAKRLDEYYI